MIREMRLEENRRGVKKAGRREEKGSEGKGEKIEPLYGKCN